MQKLQQSSSTSKNDHIILYKKAVKKHGHGFFMSLCLCYTRTPWRYGCMHINAGSREKKFISNTRREKSNLKHSQQLTLLLCLHGHSNRPSPNQVSTDWSSSTLSFSLAQYRYILELSLLWLLFVFFAFFIFIFYFSSFIFFISCGLTHPIY